MTKVNRYAGICPVCKSRVPAKGGSLTKFNGRWSVRHLACETGTPEVVEFRFSSGETMARNVNGLCEDAPCCGCCT